AGPLNEEARGCRPIDDPVLNEPEAVEVVLIEMNQIAGSNLQTAVDIVVLDGDIDAVVIEEDAAVSESENPVIEQLESINGARGRFNRAGSASKCESIDDRAGRARLKLQRTNRWNQRCDGRFHGHTSASVEARLCAVQRQALSQNDVLDVSARRHD